MAGFDTGFFVAPPQQTNRVKQRAAISCARG